MIKVVFIGTPEFSVPILEKLIENKKRLFCSWGSKPTR